LNNAGFDTMRGSERYLHTNTSRPPWIEPSDEESERSQSDIASSSPDDAATASSSRAFAHRCFSITSKIGSSLPAISVITPPPAFSGAQFLPDLVKYLDRVLSAQKTELRNLHP
jgi:hypothetical protein